MLDKKYNEVIENLSKNMESEADSAYARKVITELTLTYLDEINKIEKMYEKRLQICGLKLSDLEARIKSLEDEVIDEEDLITISCPYCNASIMLDTIEQEDEIICPDCNNIIELDWSEIEEELGLDDDDIM